jgi:hypothetical protein
VPPQCDARSAERPRSGGRWRRGLPLALAIGTLATGERAEPGIAPLLKEHDAAAASLASPRLRESPCGALASSPPCLAAGNRAEPGVGPQMAGERTAQCLQRRVSMLAFSVTAERDGNVTDLRDGYNTLAVVYEFADGAKKVCASGAKTQIIGVA